MDFHFISWGGAAQGVGKHTTNLEIDLVRWPIFFFHHDFGTNQNIKKTVIIFPHQILIKDDIQYYQYRHCWFHMCRDHGG